MPPDLASEGIQAAERVRRLAPGVGLLLLSQHVETHHALRLMNEFDRGVGYLLKDRVERPRRVPDDVRRVAAATSSSIPDSFAARRPRPPRDPIDGLTARERACWS